MLSDHFCGCLLLLVIWNLVSKFPIHFIYIRHGFKDVYHIPPHPSPFHTKAS